MTFFRNENFLLYAPLILWIIGIFYLSSNKGSMARTSPYFVPVLHFLFPKANADGLKKYHIVVRKLCHFVGYAMLALLASIVFYNSSAVYVARFWYLCAFTTVLLIASADEFRQSFHPNRDGSLSDVALDCLGGLTMIVLFRIFAANVF